MPGVLVRRERDRVRDGAQRISFRTPGGTSPGGGGSVWFMHGVDLGSPERDLRDMDAGDELVVRASMVQVVCELARSAPCAAFCHTSEGGFTRRDLARAVAEDCRRAYRALPAGSLPPFDELVLDCVVYQPRRARCRAVVR